MIYLPKSSFVSVSVDDVSVDDLLSSLLVVTKPSAVEWYHAYVYVGDGGRSR